MQCDLEEIKTNHALKDIEDKRHEIAKTLFSSHATKDPAKNVEHLAVKVTELAVLIGALQF